MQKLLFAVLLISSVHAQPSHYTVANVHSHNDYEQAVPFHWAYNASFGSIEADVFLIRDTLFLAHDTPELKRHRTLEDWYIKPLDSCVASHNGYPYADTLRNLQMLIEPKLAGVPTVAALLRLLKRYPRLTANIRLRWTITGNRPDPSSFPTYPSFIWFDGEFSKNYTPQALARVALFSDDYRNYSHWWGRDTLPAVDKARLAAAIARAHAYGKPIRFWDAPDAPVAWKQLMELGVDYLNTDHIKALATYLDPTAAPAR
jgi:alkaline phosphatase